MAHPKTKVVKRWISARVPDTNHSGRYKHQPLQVQAIIVEGIPDLFVNKSGAHNKKGFTWTVSHRPSGKQLNIKYSFKTHTAAVKMMVAIADIADWSVKEPKKLLEQHPILNQQCEEIAEEVVPKKFLETTKTKTVSRKRQR